MKRAAIALLTLIALAGCGTPITHGTVIGKQDDPPYTQIIQIPQYRQSCTLEPVTINGTTTEEEECTQVLSGYLPMPIYHPEDWELNIRDGKRVGWVDVGPDEYNSISIGDKWKRGHP